MDDLLQDTADDDGGGGGDAGDGGEPMRDPETADFLSQSLTILTTMTFCLVALVG